MSRNFEFSAMLNLCHSKENIFSILENGAKLGCVYKNTRFTNPNVKIVNISLAAELVLSRFIEDSEEGPLIYVKYHKNNFALWFYNISNKIYLFMSPTHIGWKKRYDLCNSYGINFYRYQSFMLRLIGNNIITHFETFEYFNEAFDAEDMLHNTKVYVKLYMYWPYDVYHHLKVNGKMLGITWLDANKQPIDLKAKDNALESMLNDEESEQCWYAIRNNIVLKFSLTAGPIFIIEPMISPSLNSGTLDQAQVFDTGLRTTIELFRNVHVFRLITFKSNEDLININKMDD
ncbi:MAG: hypothetical protein AB7F19_06500 [Candidatus Babeliales bacterium]